MSLILSLTQVVQGVACYGYTYCGYTHYGRTFMAIITKVILNMAVLTMVIFTYYGCTYYDQVVQGVACGYGHTVVLTKGGAFPSYHPHTLPLTGP